MDRVMYSNLGFWPGQSIVQHSEYAYVERLLLTEHANQLGGHEAMFINTTTTTIASVTFLF